MTLDSGCAVDDASLLRALAEDVHEMAPSIRERLRKLADSLADSLPVARVSEVHMSRYTVEQCAQACEALIPQNDPSDWTEFAKTRAEAFEEAASRIRALRVK